METVEDKAAAEVAEELFVFGVEIHKNTLTAEEVMEFIKHGDGMPVDDNDQVERFALPSFGSLICL